MTGSAPRLGAPKTFTTGRVDTTLGRLRALYTPFTKSSSAYTTDRLRLWNRSRFRRAG